MSRTKSSRPHLIPTTINFDPVVLGGLKDVSKELGRSVSSLINSLAANHLLCLGRIAFELDDDHEEPETNIRFIESTENSLGRSEFIRGAESEPGAGSNPSPKPGGHGHPDRAGHRRERVRL